jgi:hypothetical protein
LRSSAIELPGVGGPAQGQRTQAAWADEEVGRRRSIDKEEIDAAKVIGTMTIDVICPEDTKHEFWLTLRVAQWQRAHLVCAAARATRRLRRR